MRSSSLLLLVVLLALASTGETKSKHSNFQANIEDNHLRSPVKKVLNKSSNKQPTKREAKTTKLPPPARVLGETHPSCVELVEIHPPPYSGLHAHWLDNILEFELTFSRPVSLTDDPSYLIALSYNPFGDKDSPQQKPNEVLPLTTNFKKWTLRYKSSKIINNFFLKFRVLYLVIDNGVFFVSESLGPQAPHKIYFPLTVLGPYYTLKTEPIFRGSPPLQPLPPSPYCGEAPIRRARTPLSPKQTHSDVEVPGHGHRLVVTAENGETGTLHLSVQVLGHGTKSGFLPPSVTGQVEGVNYTVKLPSWQLQFTMPQYSINIPVKVKLVAELRERVYLSQQEVHISQDPMVIERVSSEYLPTVRVEKDVVEMYHPKTGFKTAEFVKDGKEWYEKIPHGFLSKTTDKLSKNLPHGKRKFLNKWKLCPTNSTRNPGRHGQLFHTIEYANYYQLLLPYPPGKWAGHIYGSKKPTLKVNTSTNWVDMTQQASFGLDNKMIPLWMVKSVNDYALLITPLDKTTHTHGLEYEAIYVPRQEALSSQCGGILLSLNVKKTISVAEFCNKTFGDCIGLPFSSLERYPIIHPFGQTSLSFNFKKPNSNINIDRIVYVQEQTEAKKEKREKKEEKEKTEEGEEEEEDTVIMKKRIMLTPSGEGQMDVHNIPIAGVHIVYPHVNKGSDFCSTVWQFKNYDDIISAHLVATIHNKGEGGGDFVVTVSCSPRLLVHPYSGTIRQWIAPLVHNDTPPYVQGELAVVKFSLSGALVGHLIKAHHKCELSIRIETAPQLSGHSLSLPVCSKWIVTYSGAFSDPCTHKGAPLPRADLQYYILPSSQLSEMAPDAHTQDKAILPSERTHIFVKAITVVLDVADSQRDLVANLYQLRAYCNHPGVIITQTYAEFLVGQAMGAHSHTGHYRPSQSVVVFGSEMIKQNLHFFTHRQLSAETQQYTDCWLEVWANRPHPLCQDPSLITYIPVPLFKRDEEYLQGTQGGIMYTVYGRLSGTVQVSLMGCAVLAVFSTVCAGLIHSLLFLLRKRLPHDGRIKVYRRELDSVRGLDIEYWQNPHMYLVRGPHGPYFDLHGFKATGDLDDADLKGIKIAGTLRFKNKELQVVFGHVKAVYLDKSGASKDIWIQASSGNYLLSPHHVQPSYLKEYCSLLERHGLKVDDEEMKRNARAMRQQTAAKATPINSGEVGVLKRVKGWVKEGRRKMEERGKMIMEEVMVRLSWLQDTTKEEDQRKTDI